jgi:hypothetical protein
MLTVNHADANAEERNFESIVEGDGLYTCSPLAIGVDTGKLAWDFHTHARLGFDGDAFIYTGR